MEEIARHVGASYKHGHDIRRAIKDEHLYHIPPPTHQVVLIKFPTQQERGNHAFESNLYREKVKNYVKRETILKDNMGREYALVWVQCTQAMREKV